MRARARGAGYVCSPPFVGGVCKESGVCKSLPVPVCVRAFGVGLELELCSRGAFALGQPGMGCSVRLHVPWWVCGCDLSGGTHTVGGIS